MNCDSRGALLLMEPNGKETKFERTYRSAYLVAQDLRVVQGYSGLGEKILPVTTAYIRGTFAFEDGGAFQVIGHEWSAGMSIDVSFLAIDSGEFERDVEEQRNRKLPEQEQPRTLLGGAKPLNVNIGFSVHDWEIGYKDEWWATVLVTPEEFEKLATTIESERLRSMFLSLSSVSFYTNDPYAAPSAKGIISYLRPSEDGKADVSTTATTGNLSYSTAIWNPPPPLASDSKRNDGAAVTEPFTPPHNYGEDLASARNALWAIAAVLVLLLFK
ncbi:hypothetical protein [Usitatibacter rugosus]|uniref:hypothetical protein n=1 Tax=Usitatibacter rugosus TaxID=2732067 RepID=UPI001BB14AB1|nr:hypothetical protein [Usitatibacter rugosus]